jgi:hypothetical protein
MVKHDKKVNYVNNLNSDGVVYYFIRILIVGIVDILHNI